MKNNQLCCRGECLLFIHIVIYIVSYVCSIQRYVTDPTRNRRRQVQSIDKFDDKFDIGIGKNKLAVLSETCDDQTARLSESTNDEYLSTCTNDQHIPDEYLSPVDVSNFQTLGNTNSGLVDEYIRTSDVFAPGVSYNVYANSTDVATLHHELDQTDNDDRTRIPSAIQHLDDVLEHTLVFTAGITPSKDDILTLNDSESLRGETGETVMMVEHIDARIEEFNILDEPTKLAISKTTEDNPQHITPTNCETSEINTSAISANANQEDISEKLKTRPTSKPTVPRKPPPIAPKPKGRLSADLAKFSSANSNNLTSHKYMPSISAPDKTDNTLSAIVPEFQIDPDHHTRDRDPEGYHSPLAGVSLQQLTSFIRDNNTAEGRERRMKAAKSSVV